MTLSRTSEVDVAHHKKSKVKINPLQDYDEVYIPVYLAIIE